MPQHAHLDISNINCSTPPSSNDWAKLGLSKNDTAAVSPSLCPKAVHRVLTGEEIQAVMKDCVEDRVVKITVVIDEDYNQSKKPQKLSEHKKKLILQGLSFLAQQNLDCIRSSTPLIGVQFIQSGPKFTLYLATWFTDNSFAAAFRDDESNNTVVTFSTTSTPHHHDLAVDFIRTHAAQFPFPVACAFCGMPARPRKCARCLAVEYCSKECQIRHWPEHKRVCGGGGVGGDV